MFSINDIYTIPMPIRIQCQSEYKDAVVYLVVLHPTFPWCTVLIVLAIVFSMTSSSSSVLIAPSGTWGRNFLWHGMTKLRKT